MKIALPEPEVSAAEPEIRLTGPAHREKKTCDRAGMRVDCRDMRVLGIDHGTVRIGVALSDPLGMLARPLETVPEPEALRRLPALIRQHDVQAVVLGLPLRLDGSEGPAAERVRAFLEKLRPLVPASIPIHLRDESLTTIEADRHLQATGKKKGRGPHQKIDQAAAAVILQEYLDEQAGSSLLMPEQPEAEW